MRLGRVGWSRGLADNFFPSLSGRIQGPPGRSEYVQEALRTVPGEGRPRRFSKDSVPPSSGAGEAEMHLGKLLFCDRGYLFPLLVWPEESERRRKKPETKSWPVQDGVGWGSRCSQGPQGPGSLTLQSPHSAHPT